ncbi:MAG: hypothetical protein M3460_30515 [Actinomycetota bacterium]|nr:hypothetical protein [Actinomycetota bacterium]
MIDDQASKIKQDQVDTLSPTTNNPQHQPSTTAQLNGTREWTHYKLGLEVNARHRLPAVFAELTLAI